MDEWTVGTSDAGLEQSQPLTWHRGRAQAYQVLWTEAARLVGDAVERGGASGEATGGAFVQVFRGQLANAQSWDHTRLPRGYHA